MKKYSVFLFVAAALLSAAACNKGALQGVAPELTSADELGRIPVVLGAIGEGINAEVTTKATVVDALASFNATCTTGSAGSESQVWNNVSFSGGPNYTGGKFWPNDADPSYHFYASNAAITFAAGGSTVAATNATDVICAYKAANTWKSKNDLTFDHIFGRIGNVIVNAGTGYTISGVTINITPKTGGTYNIRTGAGQSDDTGWSSLMTGSATNIANATPSTKSNDLWLVPGTYTLTASWTAAKDAYSESISGKTVDVVITKGKINTITTTLGGNANEITLGVTITPWGDPVNKDVVFPTS